MAVYVAFVTPCKVSLQRFCRAMLCLSAAYAVMRRLCVCLCVCVCVCLSDTFVDCVKMNKHIFKFFSPSDSYTILVFLRQTA